jgi:hypothetical protein
MVVDDRGWVLIDDGVVARFGPALAWARRARASRLDVIVDGGAGAAEVVARRAGLFTVAPGVWRVSGTSVVPASPAPFEHPGAAGPVSVVALLERHGCTVLVEGGVVVGEVLGLEVARMVQGELMVGVGRHDREARRMTRPGEDADDALDEAIAAVRRWRRPGVARHPANTMRRSRWLRSVVCSVPEVVGAPSLAPVPGTVPPRDLTEDRAAPCVGPSGVVVCSVGIDLDAVPTAADCRGAYRPDGSLVIVVPEGDDLPITRELAAALASPARVATVPRQWEALASAPSGST